MMENNKNKNKMVGMLILTTIVCLLPMVYGLMVYDRLPAEVPIHWNMANEVDNYSSKAFAVFGMPVLMAVLNLVVQIGMAMDPNKAGHPEKIKVLIAWIIPLLTLIVVPISLLVAQGIQIDVGFVVTLVIGILFLMIGNYLPKCRQNYTLGIRLPWTLNSEENWNRTHRMAGFVWMTGSIVIVFLAFLGSEMVMFPVLLLMVLIPIAYSFGLYKKGI